ncbi:uncharacterized protein LOC144137943 isoform X2 [Haemaphysalis longicornis]
MTPLKMKKLKKPHEHQRLYKLSHQVLCITGINFQRQSLIGFVELTLIPTKPDLRWIRINCKLSRVYRIRINDQFECTFQYNDPTLDVCPGDNKQRNIDTFSAAHMAAVKSVDPGYGNGELSVRIPSEASHLVQEGKPLRVSVEFSLEKPQGGIHFVVPECEGTLAEIHAVLKVEVDVSPPKFLTFTLKAGSNVIGRSPLCDVVIGNNAVSKRHAQLELDKHGMTIMDLGSLNKTKIGKRALKPRVRFNLEYNETFFLAGIPAHVMRDNDVAGDDTEWDTCSESLLNAAEVAEDQAGVVEAVVHSNSSTVDCHSERVDGELEHPACASTADGKQVAKPSSQSDFKTPSSHESRSSGSFNLPEMPSLEYTQSDSSQLAEPCAEDGSRKNNGATEDAVVPAGDDPSLGNSAMPKDAGDEQRLLSPADLSFVLCEATLSDNEEEDDYYCPTRKTTVDETPPHLPYFVPESDPEDDDLSTVTAWVQALDCKSTEAKDGSRDKISAAEPVAEGSNATSKQSVNDDKEPVSVDAEGKDEPEEVLSSTEEEADRTSTAKGRKKKAPSAKKGRGKKGAAPPSSKKKAAAELIETSAERKPETLGASRRGKGRAKQLEVREDLPAAECMPSDAVEDSTVSVGTRNVRAPRGGRKGAKGLSQDQENKKLESSVVSAVAAAGFSDGHGGNLETLPTCSPPKITKTTRQVASVSFGVGRRESEGEATTGEEEDMEEIEMMPGPKSKRKPDPKTSSRKH